MAKKIKNNPSLKARGKPITDEIASIKNDIIMDYVGTTALNPDKVLKSESGRQRIKLY